MKPLFIIALLLGLCQLPEAGHIPQHFSIPADSSTHLIIITIDGLRWQEIFKGADDGLVRNGQFTNDSAITNMMFGATTAAEKRKKLMPFLWNVIGRKGQLYGNREYDNHVNVANLYAVSYPGYSEMFTGKTDITIAGNNKVNNPNTNIFEYLDGKDAYRGRIGIFTSWNVVPFILNKKRAGINMNCGYENIHDADSPVLQALNGIQNEMDNKPGTRQDMLTYIAAKEYLQQQRPKILYLGLGETDEYAHAGSYDMYLQKINETDHLISELWHWVQATPGYKDNTTLIITTDHGRGTGNKWTSHGPFITGSSQTWMALLGKNIEPQGEIKIPGQLYQKQFAQTIAHLLGERFGKQDPMLQLIASK